MTSSPDSHRLLNQVAALVERLGYKPLIGADRIILGFPLQVVEFFLFHSHGPVLGIRSTFRQPYTNADWRHIDQVLATHHAAPRRTPITVDPAATTTRQLRCYYSLLLSPALTDKQMTSFLRPVIRDTQRVWEDLAPHLPRLDDRVTDPSERVKHDRALQQQPFDDYRLPQFSGSTPATPLEHSSTTHSDEFPLPVMGTRILDLLCLGGIPDVTLHDTGDDVARIDIGRGLDATKILLADRHTLVVSRLTQLTTYTQNPLGQIVTAASVRWLNNDYPLQEVVLAHTTTGTVALSQCEIWIPGEATDSDLNRILSHGRDLVTAAIDELNRRLPTAVARTLGVMHWACTFPLLLGIIAVQQLFPASK